ncbi:MAG: hydantoinase/oxoprolinase family protein [Betaproteobacteria bacterium]|nr:hydantoinase/oxoprolinase family protein [Betaproteobacteria bacterium]
MDMQSARDLPRSRVAADVGGTFTDVVAFDELSGESYFGKTLTTPEHLVEGIINAVHKANTALEQTRLFLHGTTIGINTIIERTGALTALLTTKGFRDIYEIGRINRPEAYNLFFRKHQPLVPRSMRIEVTERMNAQGAVLIPLDENEIIAIARRLKAMKVQAVAILFLHSYCSPDHEIRAKRIIEEQCPGVFVTSSHELSQEYREFERTSTVAANAYIGPRVRSYLKEIDERLAREKFPGTFFVVQSSGGLYDVVHAQRECVKMLESGPAAGVIGANAVCKRLGLADAIAFDMGGTTAKAGVVLNGEVMMAGNIMIGGYAQGLPIQVPLIDIQEVGTGGGSIARIETGGGLRVGPQSAGASPGPVCYGLGGTEPTVTDANLILGRLAPDRFLGGEMKLDLEGAKHALQTKIAKPLGIDLLDAANGIILIATTTMSNVVTRVTTERGLDAGDFAMVAYGGAGPLHAGLVARELRIPTVIIPPAPGHFSACGMLVADLRRDFVRTWFKPLEKAGFDEMENIYGAMEAEGRRALEHDVADRGKIGISRGADLRYAGQEHSVTVELPAEIFAKRDRAGVKKRFDEVHAMRYGFNAPNEPAEIVSLRSSVVGYLEKPAPKRLALTGGKRAPAHRKVHFAEHDDFVDTAVYVRSELPVGARIKGPALVEEYASTTVVFPGDELEVGAFGDLIITIDRR